MINLKNSLVHKRNVQNKYNDNVFLINNDEINEELIIQLLEIRLQLIHKKKVRLRRKVEMIMRILECVSLVSITVIITLCYTGHFDICLCSIVTTIQLITWVLIYFNNQKYKNIINE